MSSYDPIPGAPGVPSAGPPGAPVTEPPQPVEDSGLRSSVAALVLGVVLAIGVAKVVSLIGIGGELASQAAGAASGAAPLLIDGLRRRRAITRRLPRVSMNHVRFGRPPLLVASVFGFVLLIIDTFIGPYLGVMCRQILRAAVGSDAAYDPSRVLIWATVMIQLPLEVALCIALATAAAHRMTHHRARWLWFGIAVFVVVKIAILLVGDVSTPGASTVVFAISAIFLGGIFGGLSMIGMVIAHRTQAAFTAAAFFNRLTVADQQAALALLANNDDDPTNDMPIAPMRPRYRPPDRPGAPPVNDGGGPHR